MKSVVHWTARERIAKKFATTGEDAPMITLRRSVDGKHYKLSFCKKAQLEFFKSTHILDVMLTVAEGIMERCCVETAATVPIFQKVRTEYHGGRAVNDNERNNLPLLCRHYHLEANPNKLIELNVSKNNSA